MTDLPRPVHLVAEAPKLHVIGVAPAVLDAQIAPVASARMIAVFEQAACFIEATRSEIDREHQFRARRLAPGRELIDPNLVGFLGAPGIVEPDRPVLLRSDPVFPVVCRDEVAARDSGLPAH